MPLRLTGVKIVSSCPWTPHHSLCCCMSDLCFCWALAWVVALTGGCCDQMYPVGMHSCWLQACFNASSHDVLKQPGHGCKGLENLGNADSAASPKHPIECIATHSLSIIRGTLTILRLAFGLLGTLQSVTVCQHHHCCTFGGWHKWTVVCKLDADKQQLLTDMP